MNNREIKSKKFVTQIDEAVLEDLKEFTKKQIKVFQKSSMRLIRASSCIVY